ncbi:hypothetical protein C8R45DRAFT_1176459 [Mycena sanguinolenta]|nr:hypothetical protein C8R45DRAFT_1176459 [Mycena sanguinolenta]
MGDASFHSNDAETRTGKRGWYKTMRKDGGKHTLCIRVFDEILGRKGAVPDIICLSDAASPIEKSEKQGPQAKINGRLDNDTPAADAQSKLWRMRLEGRRRRFTALLPGGNSMAARLNAAMPEARRCAWDPWHGGTVVAWPSAGRHVCVLVAVRRTLHRQTLLSGDTSWTLAALLLEEEEMNALGSQLAAYRTAVWIKDDALRLGGRDKAEKRSINQWWSRSH